MHTPMLLTHASQHDLRGGGGTILGLMISRTIVEMHGGRMGNTTDRQNKGKNTFFFELPLFQPNISFTFHEAQGSICHII